MIDGRTTERAFQTQRHFTVGCNPHSGISTNELIPATSVASQVAARFIAFASHLRQPQHDLGRGRVRESFERIGTEKEGLNPNHQKVQNRHES